MTTDPHGETEGTGVEVPVDRIPPDTLRKMIEEFVTREWSELADAAYPLDIKIEQVLTQLRTGQAKVVFDVETQTGNIIPSR
jgi:uncharacterized protein YheU (UPF0270 family)